MEGAGVAGMELAAAQYCHLEYHLQCCWRNQYHLVEQRKMGVHQDYLTLGVAIQ